MCQADVVLSCSLEDLVRTFIASKEQAILILGSCSAAERDSWACNLVGLAEKNGIREIIPLAYSSRICHRVGKRSGIDLKSVYSEIYSSVFDASQNGNNGSSSGTEEDVVPLKKSPNYPPGTLFLLHEGHLVTNDYYETSPIFGSGFLLRDLLEYTAQVQDAKIAIVGDPYSLSFGDHKKSALSEKTLQRLCPDVKIASYFAPVPEHAGNARMSFRLELCRSLDINLFNRLNLRSDGCSLADLRENATASDLLTQWFSSPFRVEPDKAFLCYTRETCYKVNQWIRRKILGQKEKIAPGDLLISESNTYTRGEKDGEYDLLLNGSFYTVLKLLDARKENIPLKGMNGPVALSLTQVRVLCLSLDGVSQKDLWLYDSCLFDSKLPPGMEEAIKAYPHIRLSSLLKNEKFIDSLEFRFCRHS